MNWHLLEEPWLIAHSLITWKAWEQMREWDDHRTVKKRFVLLAVVHWQFQMSVCFLSACLWLKCLLRRCLVIWRADCSDCICTGKLPMHPQEEGLQLPRARLSKPFSDDWHYNIKNPKCSCENITVELLFWFLFVYINTGSGFSGVAKLSLNICTLTHIQESNHNDN